MLDRLRPVAASRSANEVEAYPRSQNTSRAARTTRQIVELPAPTHDHRPDLTVPVDLSNRSIQYLSTVPIDSEVLRGRRRDGSQ